ncbi:MAG: hypothetical protein ACPLRN_00910 [Microgenomates group bacterium]
MIDFYLLGFKKILSSGKKIFLILFVYLAIIALFIHFISKDSQKFSHNGINQSRQEIYKVINDEKLNSTKEGKLAISVYRGIMCSMIGEACTDNPEDGDKNFKNSFFGVISHLFVFPYANPPASGVYWVYSGLQNSGFVPKAYAWEGIGMAAIRPLKDIWVAFRDISYMLLVLVLISIGFMIMFRTKINPQTVITVENSLPKIVMALILITFSFPIAGFLIDLMYVLIILVIQILSPQILQIKDIGINSSSELVSQYLNPSLGKIFPPRFFQNYWHIGNDMYNILPETIRLILTPILQFVSGVIAVRILKSLGGTNKGPATTVTEAFSNLSAAGFSLGNTLKIIGVLFDVGIFILLAIFGMPLLLGILVFFTLIFVIFRVFFVLLFNYISVLLLIILSPVILIFEAIPGKGTFSWWLKNIMANLLSFVLVIALLLISTIIGATFSANQESTPWAPPFIWGINGQSLAGIVGLGIYLLIPDLIKMLKEAMGAKGLPVDIGLGTFFGGVGVAYGGATGTLQQFTGLAQMPGISGIIGKVPGLRELKRKVIGPSTLEVQLRGSKAILEGIMASTTDANVQKQIKDQIDKVEKEIEEAKG